MSDRTEDAQRAAPPDDLRPMLATLRSTPPSGEGWSWELKWDGIRALGYVDGGRIRLLTRNGNDVTRRYPELRKLGEALGARDVVLDGEIVAFDDDRPAELRAPAAAHARRRPDLDPAPATGGPRRVRALRPALARRTLDDGHAVRRRGAAALAELDLVRRVVADAAARGRRRRGDDRGERTVRARRRRRQARRQQVRAGTALTGVGRRSRTRCVRSSSSAVGCPARRDAPAASARSSSATTTATCCTTPAESAAGSVGNSHRRSRALVRPVRARHQPVRRGTHAARRVGSSNPFSSSRWSSPSGRRATSSASRRSSAYAPTRTPRGRPRAPRRRRPVSGRAARRRSLVLLVRSSRPLGARIDEGHGERRLTRFPLPSRCDPSG